MQKKWSEEKEARAILVVTVIDEIYLSGHTIAGKNKMVGRCNVLVISRMMEGAAGGRQRGNST